MNDSMINKHIQQLPRPSTQVEPRIGLCGRCRVVTQVWSDIIKDTFTNLDDLQSPFICIDCAPYFSTELLKTGFYITNRGIAKLKQNEFADVLFGDRLELPCMVSFSESRKKHRLYRTRVSTNPDRLYVSLDSGEVVISRKKDKPLFLYLQNFMRKHKISKSWLMNGLPSVVAAKIGFAEYMEFEKKTSKLRATAKYKFFVDIINKEE